jgi:hypothetical protein
MQTMFYWKTLQSLNPLFAKLAVNEDDFDSIRETSKFKKLIHSE